MKSVFFVCFIAAAILLVSCKPGSEEGSDIAGLPDTVGKNLPVVTTEVEKPIVKKTINDTLQVKVILRDEGTYSLIEGTITNLSEDVTFENPVLEFFISKFDGYRRYSTEKIGGELRVDTIISPKSSIKFLNDLLIIRKNEILEALESNPRATKSYFAKIKKVKRIK